MRVIESKGDDMQEECALIMGQFFEKRLYWGCSCWE